jgi:UDPglucose 6-dehydrogenase
MLAELYMPLTNQGVPLVSVGRETSEMIKYASNSFLAAKVAFINEMADICEAVGADVEDVAYGMGLDTRIGARFLKAGPGFGGSCFPKDAQALMHIAIQKDVPAPITSAVVHANLARKSRMTQKIIAACGGSVAGKTIAVLGLTFKPNTDDMRESPSLVILPELVAAGARIHAYDPEGMKEAKALLPQEGVVFVDSARAALADASAGVILTEWKEFSTLQAEDFIALLQHPLVIDLRNIYRPQRMRDAGVEYHCIGRAAV